MLDRDSETETRFRRKIQFEDEIPNDSLLELTFSALRAFYDSEIKQAESDWPEDRRIFLEKLTATPANLPTTSYIVKTQVWVSDE